MKTNSSMLPDRPERLLQSPTSRQTPSPLRAPNKSVTLQDGINMEILATMRATFLAADQDGSGQLTMEEFTNAFAGVLSTEDGGDQLALQKLFMRIDANADGTVDWDEFSSYMLLENQGAASIRDVEATLKFERPEDWTVPDNLAHKELVTHLEHVTLQGSLLDRYVTSARDGTVRIWNAKDLSHIKTIYTGTAFTTCCKLLPLSQKLGVSSFSRALKIYDLQTYEMCGSIVEIEYAPLSFDAWLPAKRRDMEMVVLGDAGGFVRLYELKLNPLEEKNSKDRFIDNERWKFQHHTDWVTHVQYVPEISSVLATSFDKTISITDIEERVPLKTLEGHQKGVHHADWSAMYKFVVSCGQDRKIILWNPFSQKPLATLNGHTSTVLKVSVNERDNQIISLGSDKTIKVWDIRNHRCLQTVSDRTVYKPEDLISVMLYDAGRRALVTGNTKLKRWPLRSTVAVGNAHTHPVTRVMFNPMFMEAVSGDHAGTVCVWHVETGRLRFRFSGTHGSNRISAMAFDNNFRRLITGSDKGELKVWNFSSGACLKSMKGRSHEEVTDVVCTRGALTRHVLACGWDRKITFYEDGDRKEVEAVRTITGHRSDILACALMEGSPTLVTSAYDGEIWVWNIESGAPKRKLLPANLLDRPSNERAVECITFLPGKHKHLLASVGADRYLRFWDVLDGHLVGEVFTGHRSGESVVALTLEQRHPSSVMGMGLGVPGSSSMGEGMRCVTGDTGGFIKLWDMSPLAAYQHSQVGFPAMMVERPALELATWRAHNKAVTSVDWISSKQGGFFLSSSVDCSISMWTADGGHVGVFGQDRWQIDQPHTWRSTIPPPMDEKDRFDMDKSRAPPTRQPATPSPSQPFRPPSSTPSPLPPLIKPDSPKSSSSRLNSPQGPPASPHLHQMRSEGYGASFYDDERPSTAPPEVARVCEVSMMQRYESLAALGGGGEGGLSEGEQSAGSSDHDSDTDVPLSLWLEDFDKARKTKLFGMQASQQRAVYMPRAHKRLNFPATVGRQEGSVAHLMHISDLTVIHDTRPVSHATRGPTLLSTMREVQAQVTRKGRDRAGAGAEPRPGTPRSNSLTLRSSTNHR